MKNKIVHFINEIINNKYNISYEEFDDIKNSVWRKLAHSGKMKEAISYMKNYLKYNKNKLDEYQRGGIYWHIGQLYAFLDDYDNAIKYMSKEITDYEYQMGTIYFLKGNKDLLVKNYKELIRKQGKTLNAKVLKRFIDNFDKRYKDVY